MAPATLVVRRGGLGDTLLCIPLLRALARSAPGELHFAGTAEYAAVLARYGVVDRAFSAEDLRLWALAGDAAARERLRRYARIVADAPELEGLAPGVDLLAPQRIAGEPAATALARQVGLAVEPRAELVAERAPSDGRVVLAPGSGAREKCWPLDRWRALAARVGSRHPLAVVLGPAERERLPAAAGGWPPGTELIADVAPVELADRIATARAFAGNDSGVTHLAAALQVPVVAVFGPTDPRVWAPCGPHVRVVATAARGRRHGPPGAGVGAVVAAIAAIDPDSAAPESEVVRSGPDAGSRGCAPTIAPSRAPRHPDPEREQRPPWAR